MKMNNIIKNIMGVPRKRGGKNDWDFDGIPNKKDCQPHNTMRQHEFSIGDKVSVTMWHGDDKIWQEMQGIYRGRIGDKILVGLLQDTIGGGFRECSVTSHPANKVKRGVW